MELTEELFREVFHSIYLFEEVGEPELRVDDSEFNVVDGEEGDYGKRKYYDKNTNVLIAVRTIHGGDSEELDFTKEGIELLQPFIIKKMNDTFEELKQKANVL